MNAIYVPKGRAREYGPLACNLYTGCSHGCTYCYAPAVLHMSRDAFAQPQPRPGILAALEQGAARLDPKAGPVFLCFSCDPYQPIEAEHGVTRKALEILQRYGLQARILTKNPGLALKRDVDLLREMEAEVGVSLVWALDGPCERAEPHAPFPDERLAALEELADYGVRTWLSIEPVIDPDEALALLGDMAGDLDWVAIGKLNHDAARERAVDWRTFVDEALTLCHDRLQSYYVKDDLWALADHDRWPTQRWGGGVPVSFGTLATDH